MSGARVRFGTTRLQHRYPVTCVAFSPDGRTVGSGSYMRGIRLWDVGAGRQLWQIAGIGDNAVSVAFSPDGKMLASANGDTSVYLWEAATGKPLRRLQGHKDAVECLAFSSDGRVLASGSWDKTICVWDVPKAERLRTFSGHNGPVTSVALSADGRTIASGSEDKTVRLWDVATGRQLRRIEWYKPKSKASGGDGWVRSVVLFRDGKTLAAGGVRNSIHLWDAASGKEVCVLPCDEEAVSSLALSPDGATLVSASLENTIRVWDVTAGKQVRIIDRRRPSSDPGFYCVAFSPDGTKLASGGHDGRIRLWELATGKELLKPDGHERAVHSIAFSPDAQRLATRSKDETVRVWEVATGKPLLKLRPAERLESRAWFPVFFSADGKTVASAFGNGTVHSWDSGTGREVGKLEWDNLRISSVALSPDGKTVALEDPVGSIDLWEATARRKLRQLHEKIDTFPLPYGGLQLTPGRISFSQDGPTVAWGGLGGPILLWDTTTGRRLATLSGHDSIVHCVAFSADGKFLASSGGARSRWGGNYDTTVRLWDVTRRKELLKLEGHTDIVYSAAFSPDGRMLGSGSSDETIRLWELATGKELLRFQDNMNPVYCVAFSPDGTTLASGMSDGTVLVWDLAPANGKIPPARQPEPNQAERLWTALAGHDAPKAYQAVWALSAAPDETISFLKARLLPVLEEKPDRTRQLIADLDHDDAKVREAASKELARLGDRVKRALRKALPEATSEEVRLRITLLLKPLLDWAVKDPETLRTVRTIWVLQRIGSKEARSILEQLAKGAPEARVTQEAKAALDYLDRRQHE